ncbi:MAG: sigma 54-interacting transcriptional regulator [Proteobacteria bacterium]|nr:sigma 54-interacting transcriptional regulator [Pseudomonadota bacterium]
MNKPVTNPILFERLLFEISSKFVNLPASDVDKEINAAIRKIVEFLGIDQCVFGEFRDDGSSLKISHGYTTCTWPETDGIILNDIAPNTILRLKRGEVVNLSQLPQDIPEDWHEELAYAAKVGLKSCVGVSLNVGGSVLGVIIFESYRSYQNWTDQSIQHMRLLAQIFANALERKQTDLKLRKAFDRIHELSEHLKEENRYLRETISSQSRYENIIGRSPAMGFVLGKIEQVAETDSTVLLLGETGTGKTLMAQLVHQLSRRKNKTMIKVNCATLPANLLESELFGHEKGAFTGAVTKKIGRFEIANGSTLFLDEIGELPLDLQSKLLRVLDDGEFERLGNATSVKVDVRIIAATNRNLDKMISDGTFRSDLFYRLNVYPVRVPPLRERLEDIPDMVWSFTKEFCKTMGRDVTHIPQKNLDAVMNYAWPGNIRELKNVVENAMISNQGNTLYLLPPERSQTQDQDDLSFERAERAHIISVLKKTGGRIKGKGGAADALMLKPSTLYSKMKKLGIDSGAGPMLQ